jgi:hypothetical protein
MADAPSESKPTSHESENANIKPGRPPRPSTEPEETSGSSSTTKTKTDPFSGVPND